MDKVIEIIKTICKESKCRSCPLSDRGKCNAQKIILLFNKYWED